MMLPSDTDELTLARNMVEVHGSRAADVARENARAAALANQPAQAKFWIKVLGTIQRQEAAKASAIRSTDDAISP